MDILCVFNNFYLISEKRSICLKDDGNYTKAIENFIKSNRLSIAINVFGNQWAIFCLLLSDIYIYPSFISMFSVLYWSINSNRTCKAQDQTLCHMPTVWPDSSVVNIHPHSERVLGSSSGRVMGGCRWHMWRKNIWPDGDSNPGPITDRANTLTT